jgi:hypothetical protein
MAVHADVQRVALGAVGVLRIADCKHKLAGTSTFAIGSGKRDLVEGILLIAILAISVRISCDKSTKIDNSVCLVSESESSTTNQAEKLGIRGDNVDRSILGSEPAIVAVARGARKEVCVVLQLDEVLAHVVGGPRSVAGHGLDVLEIVPVRVDSNECVVSSASTQGSSSWVKGTLHLGASRGAQSGVLTTTWCLVGSLEVASLPLVIRVVANEEVPCQVGILRNPGVESWESVVDIGTLVVTGFNEKCLVAGKGEAGS